MARKRPCRICRRWFEPHPRAGERQRVCGEASCQKERHRRSCVDWHRKNPGYDEEHRLRAKLRPATSQAVASDPLARLAWSAARDAVGLKTSVVIQESARVLAEWARDAVGLKDGVVPGQSDRVLDIASRDAFDSRGASP